MAGKGLRGDRYFHHKHDHMGQVTFISWEAIAEVRAEFRLSLLPAAVFRRNVVVKGVNLAALIGTQFNIQGVEFEGTQECRPCNWMDRVVGSGAEMFMRENCRGGIRAKILTNGTLSIQVEK